MDESIWIGERLALAIHNRQIAEHGGEAGVRDSTLLSSGLNRARNVFAYERESADIARMAAAYLFGIVRNHLFVDGNKRTGLVVCGVFLRLNGHRLAASLEGMYAITMATANAEMDEVQISEWIRRYIQAL